MNIPIEPFKVKLREEFLYNGDNSRIGNLVDAEVIGVSSYIGFPITFHLLIGNQYLYSDIPIHSFCYKIPTIQYSLETLSYENSVAHEIEVFKLIHLKDKNVSVYFKDISKWENGIYMMSFDYYTDNRSLHLVRLDNGQFCLIPNHKINFANNQILTDFSKNRMSWSCYKTHIQMK